VENAAARDCCGNAHHRVVLHHRHPSESRVRNGHTDVENGTRTRAVVSCMMQLILALHGGWMCVLMHLLLDALALMSSNRLLALSSASNSGTPDLTRSLTIRARQSRMVLDYTNTKWE
jgi:hypothetical protein